MPVTESAKKALRNAEAKRARNAQAKAELKRALKNVTAETIDQVVSMVDKAAKRDLIHQNKAARIKSALSKLSNESKVTKVKTVKKAKKATRKKTTTKKTTT